MEWEREAGRVWRDEESFFLIQVLFQAGRLLHTPDITAIYIQLVQDKKRFY